MTWHTTAARGEGAETCFQVRNPLYQWDGQSGVGHALTQQARHGHLEVAPAGNVSAGRERGPPTVLGNRHTLAGGGCGGCQRLSMLACLRLYVLVPYGICVEYSLVCCKHECMLVQGHAV